MPTSRPSKFVPVAGFSSIDVQVVSTHWHHWQKGQSLHHDPSRHPHATQEFQMWMIYEGCVEFHTRTQQWWIDKGDVCLIPVGLERDITSPRGASWLSIRLGITVFNKFSLMSKVPLPAQWHPSAAEWKRMKMWGEQIHREHRLQEDYHRLVVNGLASAILGISWPHLCPASVELSVHSELPDWLGRTLQRISKNPGISIAELAHEAGFSPAQFRRSFRQHVGNTPREYLKMKRFEAAKYFLAHTNLPLRTIADRIGLYDVDYFSRIFRENYGLSPTHYRASCNASEATE